MLTLVDLLRRIDENSPVVFDTSAMSSPGGKSLTKELFGKDYKERVEKLRVIPIGAIRAEVEHLNYLNHAIKHNRPVFISEVMKEVQEYINIIKGYTRSYGSVLEDPKTRLTIEELARLKKKAEALQDFITHIDLIYPRMEGRDSRPNFGAGEKAMYALYERALEKSGDKSQTNSALVATALTLSCTLPTYLITRKVSLMRTAHNLREVSQSKEMTKSPPMQPKYKLVIIDGNDPSDIREPLLASAG